MTNLPTNSLANARIIITLAAAVLLVAHLLWPKLAIDYISAVLIVIASLPWLPAILQSAKFPGGWELTFREMEGKVQNQQAELDKQRRLLEKQQEIVNQLVVFSMAFFLFERLRGLYYARKRNNEYLFHKTDDYIKDLRFLRDHGYIEIIGIGELHDGQDIARTVRLTPIGEYYVHLREEYEAKASTSRAT
jgi:Na+/alanine symporter